MLSCATKLRHFPSRSLSSMMAALHAVVLCDDVEVPYVSKEGLLASSRGMYTTARTIDKTFIMEFSAHLDRIVQSCTTMWATGDSLPSADAQAVILNHSALRPHIFRAFHKAIDAFEQHYPELDCERRVTLLLEWSTPPPLPPRGFRITTYTEPLPGPPAPPVEVKLARAPASRHGRVAKDAQWTRDRQGLEAQMGTANEVVMVDDEGNVMEGTQSNIYVVMNDKVYWPHREDILEGTVRRVVRRVCEANQLPFEPTPKLPLSSIESWQAAFLTSTSRLVLPISRCTLLASVVSSETQKTMFDIPSHPLVATLAALVRGDLRTGGVDVSKDSEDCSANS